MTLTATDISLDARYSPKRGTQATDATGAQALTALVAHLFGSAGTGTSGIQLRSEAIDLYGAVRQQEALRRKLARLNTIEADWNSYGAPKPTVAALRAASEFLEDSIRRGFLPSHIGPSPEGGVTLTFLRGGLHAAVEIDNEAAACAVISEKGLPPEIWEPNFDLAGREDLLERFFTHLLR